MSAQRSPQEYLRVLKENDDPEWWEYPRGFDLQGATSKFERFVEALSSAVRTPLQIETGGSIQDASFHSEIRFPADDIAAIIRFSNFGEMVAIRGDLPPELFATVVRLLEDFECLYIPLHVLEQPYDGQNRGVTGIPTWWVRYFDWV